MSYSILARILGKDPGDIPKILYAVEEASRSSCKSESRGPSWMVLGCSKGLIVAQVEAKMAGGLGGSALIECLLRISSQDPEWIANILEKVRAETSSQGYPLLLIMREEKVQKPWSKDIY